MTNTFSTASLRELIPVCTLLYTNFSILGISFSLSELVSHWISFYYLHYVTPLISALTRVVGDHTDLALGAILLLVTPVLALPRLGVAPQHFPDTVLEIQNVGTK